MRFGALQGDGGSTSRNSDSKVCICVCVRRKMELIPDVDPISRARDRRSLSWFCGCYCLSLGGWIDDGAGWMDQDEGGGGELFVQQQRMVQDETHEERVRNRKSLCMYVGERARFRVMRAAVCSSRARSVLRVLCVWVCEMLPKTAISKLLRHPGP